MMRRILASLGAALAISASAAKADDSSHRPQQVVADIAMLTSVLAEDGWRLQDVYAGSAAEGGTGSVVVQLKLGKQYLFVGNCDDRCTDLDLMLDDPLEQVVGLNVEPDDVPYVTLEPRLGGQYTMTTQMATCATAKCEYALAVFSR
jgi:hypothetical protein